VDRLVRQAERHAAEDRRKREEIETRNATDSVLYQAERSLRDLDGQVPADVRAEVEATMATLRTAMQGSDAADMRHGTEDLQRALNRIGERIYGEQGGSGVNGAKGADSEEPEQAPEGAIEGEFREV
jgi:molecular chaperone DnaK